MEVRYCNQEKQKRYNKACKEAHRINTEATSDEATVAEWPWRSKQSSATLHTDIRGSTVVITDPAPRGFYLAT